MNPRGVKQNLAAPLPLISGRGPKLRRLVFRPKLHVFLGAVILLYVVLSFARVGWQIQQSDRQLAILRQRLEQLRVEQSVLEREKERMHDPEYIESLARENLMIKADELVVMTAEMDEDCPPAAPAEEKVD